MSNRDMQRNGDAEVDPYTFSKGIRDKMPKSKRLTAPWTYFGGKSYLAKWIVEHLPKGRLYVEPYCGAASVFWALPEPYEIEVLNDIDEIIVTAFRHLQDPDKFKLLAHRLTWTPYAASEHARATELLKTHIRGERVDEADLAWACIVGYTFSFAGTLGGGWKKNISSSSRGMAEKCSAWRSRMAALEHFHDRLTRVQIDCIPAIDAIRYWDTEHTVFYLDPPYVKSTRKSWEYRKEMAEEDHSELVNVLLSIKGKAVLSGYENDIYASLEEAGWKKVGREITAFSVATTRHTAYRGKGSKGKASVRRTEVLWIKDW